MSTTKHYQCEDKKKWEAFKGKCSSVLMNYDNTCHDKKICAGEFSGSNNGISRTIHTYQLKANDVNIRVRCEMNESKRLNSFPSS